jgi:predicted Zn-dependent protease
MDLLDESRSDSPGSSTLGKRKSCLHSGAEAMPYETISLHRGAVIRAANGTPVRARICTHATQRVAAAHGIEHQRSERSSTLARRDDGRCRSSGGV